MSKKIEVLVCDDDVKDIDGSNELISVGKLLFCSHCLALVSVNDKGEVDTDIDIFTGNGEIYHGCKDADEVEKDGEASMAFVSGFIQVLSNDEHTSLMQNLEELPCEED